MLYVFRCSYVGCIYIYNCYIFLLERSLDHYVISYFVFCNSLCFKVYFVWYRYCYPGFLLIPCKQKTFFHFLTFSLYLSLDLKLVFCRPHIHGSSFCIHLATLCLLIEAFHSFSFELITDMYVLAILLIVFDCFCRSFLFLSPFLLFSSPVIC